MTKWRRPGTGRLGDWELGDWDAEDWGRDLGADWGGIVGRSLGVAPGRMFPAMKSLADSFSTWIQMAAELRSCFVR
jgi:hypothetical protein